MSMRWAVAVSVVTTAVMASPTTAQRPPARPVPRGVAAPVPLQVTMAGIRVVRDGAGAGGKELRGFDMAPGTALDVFVGTGSPTEFIVDIDRDQSLIETFSDDAGATLTKGLNIGSFPKMAADGSAALLTLSSDGIPSPGATAVTVSGRLAVTTANGTMMQRVTGVRIESGRSFRIGSSTITINDVSANGNRTTFTLKMTRATRNLVKKMVFKSAKGEVLKVSATGYMVMNDKAEQHHAGPPGLKTVTIDVAMWQNLWSRKVPFRVTATLGGAK